MEIDNPPPEPSSRFLKVYKIIKVVSFPILLCFFFSCSKKSNNKTQKKLTRSILKEAKYSDIPIPIDSTFIDSNDFCLVSNNSLDNNLDFYLKNMELSGWDIQNYSDDQEGLLVCNKLSRSCAVSIRNSIRKKRKTNIRIFVKEKTVLQNDKIKDINSKILSEQVI